MLLQEAVARPSVSATGSAGQPAASLPLHWSADGRPVGVHLAGRFGADETLMALSAEIEAARPWFHRRAPLRLGGMIPAAR